MRFVDEIRYIPILLIVISLATVIYIANVYVFTDTSWLLLSWITFPIFLALFVTMRQLAGKLKSMVMPVVGAIASALAIPVYLDALTPASNPDARDALIYAIMPAYQLAIFMILSLGAYFIIWVWKARRRHARK